MLGDGEAHKALGNIGRGRAPVACDAEHFLCQPDNALFVALEAVRKQGKRGDAVQQRLELCLLRLVTTSHQVAVRSKQLSPLLHIKLYQWELDALTEGGRGVRSCTVAEDGRESLPGSNGDIQPSQAVWLAEQGHPPSRKPTLHKHLQSEIYFQLTIG